MIYNWYNYRRRTYFSQKEEINNFASLDSTESNKIEAADVASLPGCPFHQEDFNNWIFTPAFNTFTSEDL